MFMLSKLMVCFFIVCLKWQKFISPVLNGKSGADRQVSPLNNGPASSLFSTLRFSTNWMSNGVSWQKQDFTKIMALYETTLDPLHMPDNYHIDKVTNAITVTDSNGIHIIYGMIQTNSKCLVPSCINSSLPLIRQSR